MNLYRVRVTCRMEGFVTVMARDDDEATEKALEDEGNIDWSGECTDWDSEVEEDLGRCYDEDARDDD